jgi:CMP-N-acetylneuraminic acid synthetase
VIIRTRNEERWINLCLKAVFDQEFEDFEVILVDNESTDKTLEKARQFPITKIVTCQDYLPGKALNLGISHSKGEFLAFLSGHCIPTHNRWLGNLVRNFSDPEVAGVYGRQEPLSFTSDFDKRDLSIIFGLDKRVQMKDDFFHNANSMIRRDIWNEIPFDERVKSIEDRIWAHKVIQRKYKIVYEPEASVYHYHGIHQDGNLDRCYNVVRILEKLDNSLNAARLEVENLNVVGIIPVRGPIKYLAGKPVLSYTVESALASNYLKRVIVSTDDPEMAGLAKDLGAEAPFLRDKSLSQDWVDLEKVLSYSLEKIEEIGIFPDLVISLEVTFPFRPKGLIDNMIIKTVEGGLDSALAAWRESGSIWKEEEDKTLSRLDSGDIPRKYKERNYIGLKGLGCVTHPEFLREGRLLGQRIGIYEVKSPYARIEVRSDLDFKLAEQLMKSWEGEEE